MNINLKGFANVVLIIALVVVLAGVFGYLSMTRKWVVTGARQLQIVPMSGVAPLTVTITSTVDHMSTVDLGDGMSSGPCLDFCPSTLTFTYTYSTPGTYKVRLLDASRETIIATAIVTVTTTEQMAIQQNQEMTNSSTKASTTINKSSFATDTPVVGSSTGADAQLDNRCTKKAVGIGMCMARFRAVEFNPDTKKCEYVDVGGCSVSSPFNETTYHDSDKELNLCQKICEI